MEKIPKIAKDFDNEDIRPYAEREKRKHAAYHLLKSCDSNSSLKLFEDISQEWWARVILKNRPSLEEYRRELVRSQVLLHESIATDILQKYPPATGLIKMIPGQTDYYPRGVKVPDFDKWWTYLHTSQGCSSIGIALPPPEELLQLCRKSK